MMAEKFLTFGSISIPIVNNGVEIGGHGFYVSQLSYLEDKNMNDIEQEPLTDDNVKKALTIMVESHFSALCEL